MTEQTVPMEWLEENNWNPNVMKDEDFEDLKRDVKAGDYNPVVVSPKDVFYGDPELPHDRYVITDGAHRWRAVGETNLAHINIDIKPMSEAVAKAYNYRRNRIKGTMDPVLEGELFNMDVEELGSEEAVAERYGRSRSYVAGRRSLVKLPEAVKELHRDTEAGFATLKKEELAADIKESNPQEAYTEEEVTDMVDAALEEQEIVPRGTLTTSHMEAITGLPEEDQKQVAAKIVEENLTVRDTETVVRRVNQRIDRRARFEKAIERAVQPTCPECGAPPKDFNEQHTYGDGDPKFNEDKFQCSKTMWHDWPFMKRPKSQAAKERQLKKESAARSRKLSEARLNPRYIRREEEKDDIIESMRPWVLQKIMQLDEIGSVSIKGLRDGKVVSIDFQSGYSALSFSVGDSSADEYHDRFYSMATTSFGFDVEKKIYKSLPYNSKLDLPRRYSPSPEMRARVHYFLDHVVNTDLDPFLPEDPEHVKKILHQYGELKEDPEVLEDDPHEEEIPLEEEEPEYTETEKRFDAILDSFIDGEHVEHDLVKVVVEGFDAEDIVGYLDMRIVARAITGNVEVYEGDDGVAYMQRLKSELDEEDER